MVDGHIKKDDWGQTGSLEPGFTDECRTRHDFSEEVKFVAARTQKRYPGVDETRALMLTREYLVDVFTARDDQQHLYVWLVHTYGKLGGARGLCFSFRFYSFSQKGAYDGQSH